MNTNTQLDQITLTAQSYIEYEYCPNTLVKKLIPRIQLSKMIKQLEQIASNGCDYGHVGDHVEHYSTDDGNGNEYVH